MVAYATGGRAQGPPDSTRGFSRMSEEQTTYLQGCLDRWHGGDKAAGEELLRGACKRLRRLARKMFRGYPGLRRWEDADDVLQNASLRLWQSLQKVRPQSARHFLNLGARQIRWELINLSRHYFGPEGPAANQESRPSGDEMSTTQRAASRPADSSGEPHRLAIWTEFHERIEALPGAERELFDLLWYQELKHAQVAALLGVNERVVRYRWQQARLRLVQDLKGELPG
jgi:RNA polymerase sigma factor (sigma-70 family)